MEVQITGPGPVADDGRRATADLNVRAWHLAREWGLPSPPAAAA